MLGLHDADPRRSYREDVRGIVELGATAVSLMPTWRMTDVRAPRVLRGHASIAQIDEAMRAALAAGLDVLLAPVIQVEKLDEGEWRGVIEPPDWAIWFESYGELLLELAELGERRGAHALLVGSELGSSEQFTEEWLSLIAAVRGRFHGSLSYQANWDHLGKASFARVLDLASCNAYFELVGEGASSSTEDLIAAWRPHRSELDRFAAESGTRLLVTEIGYASLYGAVAWPWDYTRKTPIDLAEQARAYEAMLTVWSDHRPGIFLYEWWGPGGPRDRGYTPRGKPAEQVLRRHWSGP